MLPKKDAVESKKILPQIITELQAAVSKSKLELSGYIITLDTVAHSNGHNNHADHTDVEKVLDQSVIHSKDTDKLA